MRIAYISYEYPPDSSHGGIATYVAQAARMMARRGHEVEVFVSSPIRTGRFERGGILEHCIPEIDRRQFGVAAGPVFADRDAENPFDVVEGPEYNADAQIAVELVPRVPLVVRMHTPSLMVAKLNWQPEPAFSSFKHSMRNVLGMVASACKRKPVAPFLFAPRHMLACWNLDLVEAAHARQAAIVAPPCQDLCNYARDVWRVPAGNIRLVPGPYVPETSFLTLTPPTTGFTVGFIGRLEKRKGIETLAAAIPAVLRAVPEAKFRFFGTSDRHSRSMLPYEDWIRQHVPQHRGQLEFMKKYPPERMAEAYGSVDVCVVPSPWENFSYVGLEAMAAGRAIVASDVGGLTEMLDHGRAGHLAKPGNSDALAREIISLLKSPSERKRLGEMARQRVLKTYNETVVGKMMEDIYREAILRKAAQNQKPAIASH
jgi:glycosyltransferase involved in cell wall biosynthesis